MEEAIKIPRDVHCADLKTLLKPVHIFLRCGGLWPLDRTFFSKCRRIYHVTSIGLAVFFQLRIITIYPTDMDVLVGVGLTLFLEFLAIFKFLILLLYRKDFADLIHTTFDEYWPINTLSNYKDMVWFINNGKKFLWTLTISATVTCVYWTFFPYTDRLPGNRKHGVLIGFPKWMHENDFPNYYIINFAIMSNSLFLCYSILGYDCLFVFILTNLVIQIRLLCQCLNNITNQTGDEKSYQEFVFCVKYHRRLMEICAKLQQLCDVNNGVDTFLIIFMLVTFFILAPEETDMLKLGKLVIYVICVSAHVIIYGIGGSWIEHEAEKVADAAYNCLWYEKPSKLRLGLIHMIRVAQRPIVLTALSLTEMNCPLLITIFKTAFSIATLFKP